MLSDEQLLARLSEPESELLERKESVTDKETRKTLVAMANSVKEGSYGVVLYGVTNDGKLQGLQGIETTEGFDSLQKSIRAKAQGCYPPIDCQISLLSKEGKKFIAVVIGFSRSRPHFAGHAYVRRGSESISADEETFNELLASRNDKARKILANKKQLVTIHLPREDRRESGFIGYRPSKTRDFEILDCDAHMVRFSDHASGKRDAASLEDVKITYDSTKNRLQLIIEKD